MMSITSILNAPDSQVKKAINYVMKGIGLSESLKTVEPKTLLFFLEKLPEVEKELITKFSFFEAVHEKTNWTKREIRRIYLTKRSKGRAFR
jgi:hypothetical protein